ncbi:MAG: DUF2752 domain-containing protein [Gemmataceae bacterium]
MAKKTIRALDRAWHLQMLILCALALAAAPLLQVQGRDKVSLRGWSAAELPPLCGSQIFFGISCPGCGLTRSWVSLAHGEVSRSLDHHRLGWLLMLLALLQIPYRLHALYTGKPLLPDRLATGIGLALIAALFLNWLVGLWFTWVAMSR